jgi:hypothetical protein
MVHKLDLFAIHFVSTLFLLGMAGSAVVVLLAFFGDFRELFSNDQGEVIDTRPPNT